MKKMQRGFTIFFAVLVSSLALAVGVAVFDLTLRELDLSQTATQSQFAIYAADAGAECGLYWDYKCPVSGGPTFCTRSLGSAFATSSAPNAGGASTNSNLTCNGLDITDPDAADAAYAVSANSNAATTTFTVRFTGQGRPYCANITVAKWGNPPQTKIVSRGYNTCASGSPLQLERSLQLLY